MEIVSFEKRAIEDKITEKKEERRALVQKAEFNRQKIMFYSGELSGLSIFDVLCVLFALFTVEVKWLIALLNKDAQTRLLENEFIRSLSSTSVDSISQTITIEDVAPGASAISVTDAVAHIEETVKTYFLLADSFYNAKESSGENKANKE